MRSRFISSGRVPSDFPDTGLPEIAFVGRSNVGKSSLLNKLAQAKIARTSRTPGRTQMVNFFEVEANKDQRFALADLPGYGFAKAPKEERARWYETIEAYLSTRQALSLCLVLIDIRRGAQPDDVEVLEWLNEREIASLVVVTKADKVARSKRKPVRNVIARACGREVGDVFIVSAKDALGIAELSEALLEAVA